MTRSDFLALLLTAAIGYSAGMNATSHSQANPAPAVVASQPNVGHQTDAATRPTALEEPATFTPGASQPIQPASAATPLLANQASIRQASTRQASTRQITTAGENVVSSNCPTCTHETEVGPLSEPASPHQEAGTPKSAPRSLEPNAATRSAIRSAILAQQRRLQVIANNLANANTPAFKRERLIVERGGAEQLVPAGQHDTSGNPSGVGVSFGQGVRIVGVEANLAQGAARQTERPLDLMIEGKGFFQVADSSSGETLYTRAGAFQVNANGDLVSGGAYESHLLEPAINIPPDATDIVVTKTGDVEVHQPGSPCMTQVGTIQLATFVNPQGLKKAEGGFYRETGSSGSPRTGTAGQNGVGIIRQHCLESSNVEPTQELLELAEVMRQAQWLQKLQTLTREARGQETLTR